MFLGQDRNFDLANYHLYNGFSFLNNKLSIDIAAAGVQTYLNPLLDVFFYYLNTHLNPHFFGFLMGALHSINIILLLEIIISMLPLGYKFNTYSKILLIFFAGSFSPNFLAGLGSSMGDNTTSLFVLSALLLILKNWISFERHDPKMLFIVFLSGLLMGSASSLKLTNAVFMLSLFLSFFCIKISFKKKLTYLTFFSFGALFGLMIFGYFWYFKMWEMFHNPIFPYLSNIFTNSNSTYSNPTLAWLPKGLIENIFWPYFFTINYHRVGEGSFHQILWPLFYSLLILFLFCYFYSIVKREKFSDRFPIPEIHLFLIVYITISYFIWMRVFSVLRYMISIEILLPLASYLLFICLFKHKDFMARRVLFFSIVLTLFGGFSSWGHSRWTDPPFNVELPNDLESEAIVILAGSSPITWMASQYPKNISFVKFGPPFNFDNQIRKKISLKSDKTYVMFGGFYNWREDNTRRWSELLHKIGLLKSIKSCKFFTQFIEAINFRGKIYPIEDSKYACRIGIHERDFIDPNKGNQFFIDDANRDLTRVGFYLIENSCEKHSANIGSQNWKYIWCRVQPIN